MDIRITTYYEPGKRNAIIEVRYTIDPLQLVAESTRRGGAKGAILWIFKQMQRATFDFMKHLIMSDYGFRAKSHSMEVDERMLTEGSLVLDGEIVE